MVKMVDRITNLQPPLRGRSRKRIADYRQQAMGILASLGSTSDFLAQRLTVKIKQYGIRVQKNR